MKFSAVILAGGNSSRMGCDKAFMQSDGRSLLERQIGLVLSIGAGEIFISGRKGCDYSAFGCPILLDHFEEAGPLAGIERALEQVSLPLLLVLAVDMPGMTKDFLGALVSLCANGCGAIPRLGGNIEPLAAVYPRTARKTITEMLLKAKQTGLVSDTPAARKFAERCVQMNLAAFVDVSPEDAALFANWNTPADV